VSYIIVGLTVEWSTVVFIGAVSAVTDLITPVTYATCALAIGAVVSTRASCITLTFLTPNCQVLQDVKST